MPATRLIIVDDHPLFRGALHQALSASFAQAEIQEAGSLDELTAKLALTVNHATASAKAAVEKAGGTVTVIVPKVLAADVEKAKKSAAKKAKAGKKTGKAEE